MTTKKDLKTTAATGSNRLRAGMQVMVNDLRSETANYTGIIHIDGVLDYLYARCEESINGELTRKRRA